MGDNNSLVPRLIVQWLNHGRETIHTAMNDYTLIIICGMNRLRNRLKNSALHGVMQWHIVGQDMRHPR